MWSLHPDLPRYLAERRRLLDAIRIETEPFQEIDTFVSKEQRQAIEERDEKTRSIITDIRERISNLSPEIVVVLATALAAHPIDDRADTQTAIDVPLLNPPAPEGLKPLRGQIVRDAEEGKQEEKEESPPETEAEEDPQGD